MQRYDIVENALLLRRAEESLGYVGEMGRGGGGRHVTRLRTKKTQGYLAAAWGHIVTCLKHKLKYDFRQNVCFSRSIRENEKTEHGKTKQCFLSLSKPVGRWRSEPCSEASAYRSLSPCWRPLFTATPGFPSLLLVGRRHVA